MTNRHLAHHASVLVGKIMAMHNKVSLERLVACAYGLRVSGWDRGRHVIVVLRSACMLRGVN